MNIKERVAHTFINELLSIHVRLKALFVLTLPNSTAFLNLLIKNGLSHTYYNRSALEIEPL